MENILEEPYKKEVSYTAGFFMLIAFCVAGLIFASLIGMFVFSAMTGVSFLHIQDELSNPQHYRAMQVFQSISTVLGLLVPTLLTASRLSNKPLHLTGFKGKINLSQFFIVLLITICGLALSSSLGYLSYQLPLPKNIAHYFQSIENNYNQQAANLINVSRIPEVFISIFVLAFIPAVCEEVVFRGGLQNYMYRSSKNMWLSILVVSFLFSIIHISGYGFLSRFTLGILLGLIYHYSGRIWLNILFHFINNAAAVLSLYYYTGKGKSIADAITDKEGNYWGLLVIPILVLLFIQFKKVSKPLTPHGI